MRRPLFVAAKRAAWQIVLALLAFLQVVATFAGWADTLYVAKWLGGVAIVLCLFALGRCRISTQLAFEFALVAGILAIGLITQLGDALDTRAVAVSVSYALTASAAFLVAPCALRRRSVHRLVWPALLLGVAAGTLLAEYLGVTRFIGIWSADGRWRFAGAFNHPNAAGVAGLIGVVLAAAAFSTTRRWRYVLLVPPFVLTMVLADSRGSLLAAAALLGVSIGVRLLRWPARRLALASCLALLMVMCYGRRRATRIEEVLSTNRISLNEASSDRLAVWTEALAYLTNPLEWTFGLGMSRNISFVGRRTTSFEIPVRGSNTDNFYVDLLGRTGITGVLLFLALIGSLLGRLCRRLREVSPRVAQDRALGLSVLAATLVLGVTNSVIFTWGWLHAMVAWPLVAAVAARAESRAPSAQSP